MTNSLYNILIDVFKPLSMWRPKLESVTLSKDEKTVDIVFVLWTNCEDKHVIPFYINFTLLYELYDSLDMLQLNDKLGWDIVPRMEYP